MNKKISVVIPAYNEEESIAPTIMEIKHIFENIKLKDYEIIIVNNNSTDRTSEIAKNMGAIVLFEPFQPGYGASYKRGFTYATGDIIITGDADSTYPFYDIPRFLRIMKKGKIDFINTNRYSSLDKNSMPFINYIGNIMLTKLTNFLYGSSLKDSQSGMWIFKRKKLLDLMNLNIMGGHMAFSQEIKLYSIFLKEIKFEEVPIRYRVRIGDKKLRPIQDGWANFVRLLKFKSYLQMERDKRDTKTTNKWNFIDKILAKARIGKIKKHIKKGSVVLDVGCGYDHRFLNDIKKHTKYGIGIDFQVKSRKTKKIETHNRDFEKKKLPVKKDSVDFATMIATIEHIYDPKLVLSEIYRVLKPGGKFFLTTPTPDSKPILETLCFTGILKNKDSLDHKLYYNKRKLIKVLKDAGFKVIKHKYFQFGLNQYIIVKKKG